MAFAYDSDNDRVVLLSGGSTWVRGFDANSAWVNLGIASPPGIGNERAIYDALNHRMVVLTESMQVFALGQNSSSWVQLSPSGPSPPARGFFAIAHDQLRNRLLLFGGGPGTGLYNDVWALTLSGTPSWTQLQAQGDPPAPAWGPLAVYDSHRDRLIVATGSVDGGYTTTSAVWALTLEPTLQWTQLAPTGGPLPPRHLSAAIYDPGSRSLLLFGGHGPGALDDLWELSLDGPQIWHQLSPSGSLPPGRWSHGATYRSATPSMIVFGGWSGGEHNDTWSISLGDPATTAPVVTWFTPLGGRVGDEVTVFGSSLAAPEEVTFAGTPAQVLISSYGAVVCQVPPGAVTGRIRVTTSLGSAESPTDFVVGQLPQLTAAMPDSGSFGDSLRIMGEHLLGVSVVRLGDGGYATIVASTDTSIDVVVDSLATTGKISVTTIIGTQQSAFDFHRLTPVLLSATPDSGRFGDTFLLFGRRLSNLSRVMIGENDNAPFVILSDTLAQVTVTAAAATGKITVRAPGAVVSSSFDFIRLADDPRPHLLAVRDVPADQGGRVILAWRASDYDQPYYGAHIAGYRVWRRAAVPLQGPLDALWGRGPDSLTPTAANQYTFWENIADLPAAHLRAYAYTAATHRDSMEGDNPYTAFFIQAITYSPTLFYHSNVDSGYSVDNLSPPAPAAFSVTYNANANLLHWRSSAARDLYGFQVYRGGSANFELGPATHIATTSDTTLTDVPGAFYYKLVAVDLHGNRSRALAVAPDRPVAALATLVEIRADGSRVLLRWSSAGNVGMVATVYRRTPEADWLRVGEVLADGDGVLKFEDPDVVTGTTYGYRLGVVEPDVGELFVGEGWITLKPLEFGIEKVWPNPATGGRVNVVLAVAGMGPARLELFDLAGRRIEAIDVDQAHQESQHIELPRGARLEPGLYFLRLVSKARVLTARFAVVE